MLSPIDQTRAWVRHFVVGLGLCPFAKVPFKQDRIRYLDVDGADPDHLIRIFLQELEFLSNHPATVWETTLLVISAGFTDFLNYLDFVAYAELMVREAGLEGEIQLASFHPDYVFGDAPTDDPAHRTNRAPYPLLHLLREASVEAALQNVADPGEIPLNNIRLMREMGEEDYAKLQQKWS